MTQAFPSNITVGVIDSLAEEVHNIAWDHGFYADQGNIIDLLTEALIAPRVTDEERLALESAKVWVQSSAEQAAIARMHSELSEWLEVVRKDSEKADEHCPKFFSAEVEAADLIIRVLDTCGFKGYRIGAALVAKMEYNRTRPYKHDKNS